MGMHTNKRTGAVRHLPYQVDLRFMKGSYIGTDGGQRQGAFALI